MAHRPSRNPWLPLLLLAALVLSCALHATADHCSTAIGTDKEEDSDSGKGGDCHKNHTHTHGHHDGDGGKDKDKPGTPAAGSSSNSNNPWVVTAATGAAPRTQAVSGFTAASGVIVLITGAVVSWLAAY